MQVLLVEQDAGIRKVLARVIEAEGELRVDAVADGASALAAVSGRSYAAVIASLELGAIDGIELVRRLRAAGSGVPYVLLAGGATVEAAVAGMRAGATDFLPKPVNPQALLKVLRALGISRAEGSRGMGGGGRSAAPDGLVGHHPLLDQVRRFAARVARVPEARVLITGESGTGKSSLARAIHELSGSRGQFVEVSCANLPPALIESELFGHEKGAFTDARATKRGLVEVASGGTLFLDEIGTLPLETQSKLLTFLESRHFRRVGGNQAISSSARVIAASNEDLRQAVAAGRFRQDLFYRLDVASVRMPSLREMRPVLPALAAHFVAEVSRQFKRPAPAISPSSLALLAAYAWPGNARELRNVVERALIFHEQGPLELEPPSAESGRGAGPEDDSGVLAIPRGLTLDEVERLYIEDAMKRNRGDLSTLAAALGISRKTLWDKRRRYNAMRAEEGGPESAVEAPPTAPRPQEKPARRSRAAALV